jgi:hypothetical protein
MDTTVFRRFAARDVKCAGPRNRRAHLAARVAAVVAAAVTLPATAQAQPATTAPRAPAAQPGRFEPASDAKGYEVFDQTAPAAASAAAPDTAPAAAPARSGFIWPTFGAAKDKPAAVAKDKPAAVATGEPARDAAPADTAAAAGGTGPTWFSDDAVSLAGWLFGHHGAAVVEDYPGVPVMVDPCDCPTWIGQIDALMLWMGNIPSRPLYLDSATGATAINANQLVPGISAAPRYAVIYNRDQCRSIEVNYFSIWGFDAQRQLIAVDDSSGLLNGMLEMNDLAGLNFDQIGAARAVSSAHIQSLEINLRRVEWEWVRWITGFRWVEWGQGLDLADAQFTDVDPAVPDPSAIDLLSVATLNNLYGWQWGADAMLWNNGGWLRVNGIAKAGVYYNHQALQRTSYDNFLDPPTAVAANRDTVSFFGEAGITGSWAITNWLSWRAGYTLFWLEGIATPVNQLSGTVVDPAQVPTAAISPFGGVFLHGVNTGLEARW